MDKSASPDGRALIPFLVFALFYAGLSLYAGSCGFDMPWYKVPMPVAFLVASASAFLLGRASLERKVDAYARGMGETNIMIMCLVFILAGSFAAVAKGTGAVDAAVTIALALVPAKLLVAGVFVVACLISTAIGTSCGTIAAVMPVALGFVGPLGVSPALMMGAVVGGAMFGDNLSMISDTTIAATRTQGVAMKEKFRTNLPIAIPAALAALALYALAGSSAGAPSVTAVTAKHLVLVAPYVLVLALAIAGFNVMALLFGGTLLSAFIGFCYGTVDFFGALDLVGKGTLGMGETLVVAILAGGLFALVKENGGVAWLTDRITRVVRGPRTCEAGIALLVSLVNAFTANNTVAIVIAGPVARECSERFGAKPARVASVLDTCSCIVQGLLPYGAQVLIAIGIAKGAGFIVGPGSLFARLYYPPILALAVILWVILARSPARASCAAGDKRV